MGSAAADGSAVTMVSSCAVRTRLLNWIEAAHRYLLVRLAEPVGPLEPASRAPAARVPQHGRFSAGPHLASASRARELARDNWWLHPQPLNAFGWHG
jgi:hypothetical protein